jgi:hypothetical protein
MSWTSQLRGDSISWLLETDSPGVRYLALRDLLDLQPEDSELKSGRKKAHKEGPIATVLSHMEKEGYWARSGAGYGPKYRSTVWSIIILAQLGGLVKEDRRISKACGYLLDHALMSAGLFTASNGISVPVDCLQGNLCWSLRELGSDDQRLTKAYEWMARTVTGDGVAPASDRHAAVRYYSHKCGPDFACGANGKLPCAWGAVKVMLAFGNWPADRRTPLIKQAIKHGIDFLLGTDPATAQYPVARGDQPSRNWWKFGFPVFYITDLLQVVEALIGLGRAHERRLTNALQLIRQKQDDQGRWPMEYNYSGKNWVDFGEKRRPNKWVTLRALRVLKAVG